MSNVNLFLHQIDLLVMLGIWVRGLAVTTRRMSGLQAACRVETESESPAHTLSSVCACAHMHIGVYPHLHEQPFHYISV